MPNDAQDPQALAAMAADEGLSELGRELVVRSSEYKYSYNFTWLGRPIIQYPQDIVALQEIIWSVQPDLVIETGIAHGGSLVLSASLLELLGGRGEVVGIDVDIRGHNRRAIEAHPMARRIVMLEGSSTDPAVVEEVRRRARDRDRIVVVLDSNHTHEHVLEELRLYSPLVTPNSYLVVFDTVVEHMPPDAFPDRPWSRGNNPLTAVREFLASSEDFVVDSGLDAKLLVTVAPGGYLRRLERSQS